MKVSLLLAVLQREQIRMFNMVLHSLSSLPVRPLRMPRHLPPHVLGRCQLRVNPPPSAHLTRALMEQGAVIWRLGEGRKEQKVFQECVGPGSPSDRSAASLESSQTTSPGLVILKVTERLTLSLQETPPGRAYRSYLRSPWTPSTLRSK